MCADAERMSMPIVLVLAVTVGNGSVRTALMTFVITMMTAMII